MEFKHKSVLLNETIEGLSIRPDGIYVDGTLGGAGHASEVCQRLSAKGRFIGIDQDQDAIIAANNLNSVAIGGQPFTRSNYCILVLIYANKSPLGRKSAAHFLCVPCSSQSSIHISTIRFYP